MYRHSRSPWSLPPGSNLDQRCVAELQKLCELGTGRASSTTTRHRHVQLGGVLVSGTASVAPRAVLADFDIASNPFSGYGTRATSRGLGGVLADDPDGVQRDGV